LNHLLAAIVLPDSLLALDLGCSGVRYLRVEITQAGG